MTGPGFGGVDLRGGLSQERVACDAEVDRSYVGSLERQKENPTVDVLERLAKTLGGPLSRSCAEPTKRSAPPKPVAVWASAIALSLGTELRSLLIW